ncbi:cyclin-dependent kinase-like 2 isoform X1 [Mesocricetus auratus]|uniref:Cyclin-dependent kinase-like 2 n=1 Tax=Mesocricetus auratus TaxID=10036 RepID=A0A1U8BJ37_MESAU|nr:cyclin-dependent kinase-like 2 isoform X1 [Mesocricetus auratus]XP_012967491.1 cyclin-dependent kinase-like 2 isoform X1 [Mesocricetus auratus]XP_040603330.1 cyclin-dependent kinase-like 2 isoform X1 [Mesocricetus auratus]XP_040603331.1 cyclin-dependent kinase-like 2 isoform X1 [Mesocricetus auratus]
MEKYENLGLVGEGSYGMVMKCRNKDSGRIVAIKKFLESDDDKMVKKIAMREIKLLKQLRHENLVNLLEVCKKKKRWYLVFEFVDHTVLDDLKLFPNGLDYQVVQKYLFQIINGIGFCHSHNIIHRDIKPENILVSQSGVVKLCDFGFARTLAAPGEVYTDYVATRWYRAPELLVGDVKYGKAVDVWAIGCLVIEMLMGQPLFPGESDIDQLHHIMTCLGNLIPRHQELFYKNPVFAGVRLPEIKDTETEPLENRYPKLPEVVINLAKKCLHIDPDKRPFCADLLHHDFFQMDGFAERFSQELQLKIEKDARNNSLPKKSQNRKKEKDDALGEERKTLVVQDTNADPKIKDSKVLKIKGSKIDGEKSEKGSRASNAGCLHDNGTSHIKGLPSTSLRDCSNVNVDHPRNPGMAIPPLTHNLSAVAPGINAGMGTIPGVQSYRVDEKTKKYCNPFVKQSQPSPSGIYNMNAATSVSSEKYLLQANKKRKEYSKADVRLPELNYNHLPELRALEGIARNSRLIKKENKSLSESRIPSLAAIDLHASSIALHQGAGSPLSDDSEGDLPRMEHQH